MMMDKKTLTRCFSHLLKSLSRASNISSSEILGFVSLSESSNCLIDITINIELNIIINLLNSQVREHTY